MYVSAKHTHQRYGCTAPDWYEGAKRSEDPLHAKHPFTPVLPRAHVEGHDACPHRAPSCAPSTEVTRSWLASTRPIGRPGSTGLYRPTHHTMDRDANVVVVEGVPDALAIAAAAARVGEPAMFAPATTSPHLTAQWPLQKRAANIRNRIAAYAPSSHLPSWSLRRPAALDPAGWLGREPFEVAVSERSPSVGDVDDQSRATIGTGQGELPERQVSACRDEHLLAVGRR